MSQHFDHGDSTGLTNAINDVRGGDSDAFRKLCTPSVTRRVLLAITCQLPDYLRARIDPEDILQIVLSEAWRDIGSLKDRTTLGFHRWIAVIARNSVIDIIRRHKRPKRDVTRDEAYRTSWEGDAGMRDQHTPSRSAARREQVENIAALLDMLKESYREVIVRRILEAQTTSEVAELTDTEPGTVSQTLRRALKRFRRLMDEQGIDTTIFRPL